MQKNIKDGKCIAPGIYIYENVLEDPKKYIDFAMTQENWYDAKVFADRSENASVVNKVRNNSFLNLEIGFDKPIEWFEIGSLIFSYTKKYAEENEFSFSGMEPLVMLHYKSGEGFYNPHIDHHDTAPRVCAALLYLNDVEEGGETHFVNFDISIKPKAGTLVLFPGNYPYLHGAKTPLSGDKFAVVTWFSPVQGV